MSVTSIAKYVQFYFIHYLMLQRVQIGKCLRFRIKIYTHVSVITDSHNQAQKNNRDLEVSRYYLFLFKKFFNLLFIYYFYFWLCWVFISVRGLSPAAASGGHSSSRCAALSLSRPPLLWSTGSRRSGSVVVAHGPSCSAACGILPDQGSNPCPPHWQADSQPLRHQGSPTFFFLNLNCSDTPETWKAKISILPKYYDYFAIKYLK